MYQYIVQNSVTSKTTHNLSHIVTTNTITAGTLVPAVLMATSHSYGNGQI